MIFWQEVSAVLEYHTLIFKGLGATLLITVGAFLIGQVLGVVTATIKVARNNNSNVFLKILNALASVYVTVIRGTPVVVQLLLMYFVILGASPFLNPLIVAIAVFGINSGAYVAETMRGGILSVDKGQMEAGRSLGLSFPKTMVKVVVPQATKNSLPALFNELIALLKETSVAGYITVVDLTRAFEKISNNETSAIVPYIMLAVIYLAIVGILTLIIRQIEKRLQNDRN